jgi:hypothetical protein
MIDYKQRIVDAYNGDTFAADADEIVLRKVREIYNSHRADVADLMQKLNRRDEVREYLDRLDDLDADTWGLQQEAVSEVLDDKAARSEHAHQVMESSAYRHASGVSFGTAAG